MTALEDQLIGLGVAPWCMGMEAGTATGWQFTDWVEEVLLRTETPEVYNQWITHELPFNSPEVRAAFERVINMIYKEGNVFGGPGAVMATATDDALRPGVPGGRQLGWLHARLRDAQDPDLVRTRLLPGCPGRRPGPRPGMYEIGTDIGIFYLPMIDAEQGTPALGSADSLIVLAKDPGEGRSQQDAAVRAVAQFLSTPQGTQRWIEAGSAISANNTTPQDWYAGFHKLDIAAQIVNYGFLRRFRRLRPDAARGGRRSVLDRVRQPGGERSGLPGPGAPEHRRGLADRSNRRRVTESKRGAPRERRASTICARGGGRP